jgi:hypothetical protein
MVEKAGAIMGKMSLLSMTEFGMNSPANKTPTIDKRITHNVTLTINVTQNVSFALLLTITPLNHVFDFALNQFVCSTGRL